MSLLLTPALQPDLPPRESAGWFTVDDLRAQDTALQNTARFPNAKLQATMDDAVSALEDAMHVAWVPRTWTGILNGTGTSRLFPPINNLRDVIAAEIDGQALDLSSVQAEAAFAVYRAQGWPRGVANITITIEHGYDAPPRRVRRAGLILAKLWALKGPIDDRATQIPAGDGGSLNLATPGIHGSTFGIPEVDEVAARYGLPDPATSTWLNLS